MKPISEMSSEELMAVIRFMSGLEEDEIRTTLPTDTDKRKFIEEAQKIRGEGFTEAQEKDLGWASKDKTPLDDHSRALIAKAKKAKARKNDSKIAKQLSATGVQGITVDDVKQAQKDLQALLDDNDEEDES